MWLVRQVTSIVSSRNSNIVSQNLIRHVQCNMRISAAWTLISPIRVEVLVLWNGSGSELCPCYLFRFPGVIFVEYTVQEFGNIRLARSLAPLWCRRALLIHIWTGLCYFSLSSGVLVYVRSLWDLLLNFACMWAYLSIIVEHWLCIDLSHDAVGSFPLLPLCLGDMKWKWVCNNIFASISEAAFTFGNICEVQIQVTIKQDSASIALSGAYHKIGYALQWMNVHTYASRVTG